MVGVRHTPFHRILEKCVIICTLEGTLLQHVPQHKAPHLYNNQTVSLTYLNCGVIEGIYYSERNGSNFYYISDSHFSILPKQHHAETKQYPLPYTDIPQMHLADATEWSTFFIPDQE